MQAGRLRHRIALQRYSEGERDENGFPIPGSAGWATESSMWGSVEGINGREFVAASAEQAAVTWRITVRHSDAITPDKRLLCDGRVFNIKAILPDNDKGRMTIMAETGVNQG